MIKTLFALSAILVVLSTAEQNRAAAIPAELEQLTGRQERILLAWYNDEYARYTKAYEAADEASSAATAKRAKLAQSTATEQRQRFQ